MTVSQAHPQTIARLLDAVYPSFALLAGMKLELFTLLKDGPLSPAKMSGLLGVPVGKLRPLLYALVVAGLLTLDDGLFSNSAEANHYLVRGRPAYLGGSAALTAGNWERLLKTAETIRTGAPPARIDYHAPSTEEMVALFRGLYPGAAADARRLMQHADFSTRHSLLDVGGGSGALAIAIAQANPHLQATVLELPSVTPVTRLFVDEAGLGNRVQLLAGDAVHHVPPGGYDIIVARHLIQVLSVDESRATLRNITAALQPGGALYLIGWVLDDSRLSPPNIVGYNLVLLTAYQDGQAYTESEYRSWLLEAGLTEVERAVMDGGASIITAHNPV